MKPAGRMFMYRGELVRWLGAEGLSEWRVRELVRAGVIRAYRWEDLVGGRGRRLPRWQVFAEAQVRAALEERADFSQSKKG